MRNIKSLILCFMLLTHISVSGHGNNPLHPTMEEMGTLFKTLGFGLVRGINLDGSPLNSASDLIDEVQSLRDLSKKSLTLTPHSLEMINNALDKEKANLEYLSLMYKLTGELLELEINLLNNDLDAAKATFMRIAEIQKSGHAQFKI